MENLRLRFPHLFLQIFEELDLTSLLSCRQQLTSLELPELPGTLRKGVLRVPRGIPSCNRIVIELLMFCLPREWFLFINSEKFLWIRRIEALSEDRGGSLRKSLKKCSLSAVQNMALVAEDHVRKHKRGCNNYKQVWINWINIKHTIAPYVEGKFLSRLLRQEGASEWRVHSTLIFENLKLAKISKNSFNTI